MLNFITRDTNNFIIWSDGINDFNENYFILELKNGFTNVNIYTLCNIVIRNERFIELSITEVAKIDENPLLGLINITPTGNFDYKLWNTSTEDSLDITDATLVDTGQMQLISNSELTLESDFLYYVSDNEDFQTKIYDSIS